MSTAVPDLHGVQLPERYEIRRLEEKHVEWVSALTAHANIYQAWFGTLFEGERAKKTLGFTRNFAQSYGKTIEIGMSYGVFDKEYKFKRPESAATGGALYFSEFDENDPELEVNGRQKLEDAMDFPLVSHGMQYDGSDSSAAALLFGTLGKEFPIMNNVFSTSPPPKEETEEEKKKKEEKPKPKWGELVGRDGTATRDGYTGKGLAKALAHWLLHEAHAKGYKRMVVVNNSLAVQHIYSNPPAPYRANVLMEYHAQEHETVINGEKVKAYLNCKEVFMGCVEVVLSE